MSLLLIEIPLALLALRRGWRVAPLMLLALPFGAAACESVFAALLGPVFGSYFDPAGTVRALAHGGVLVGLAIAAAFDPSERPVRSSSEKPRRAGSLYQI